ncbi:MAG: Na+/H+ antiporter NhaA [Micropruina sp.]|nr:Na+/H+ antiporter NhaA [Micropruina sp.]
MSQPTLPLRRATQREWQRLQSVLRTESIGGMLLLAAGVAALIWANTAPQAYLALRDAKFGVDVGDFHLRLSLGHWAADGLLAVFFFMAGLELKREFVEGELRDPAKALVPIAAAVAGVVVPALIYVGINLGAGAEPLRGWAIPTATDIAFALAVLAVIGSHLPTALRTFLLTLAVVDDLIAIVIIALFYSSNLNLGFLAAALGMVVVFGFVVRRWRDVFEQRGLATWFVLLPVGLAAWALLYNSGVHATVAGVLTAFTVPVGAGDPDRGLAHSLEHRIRPLSAGFAVPVFAFFSAGVVIGGGEKFVQALTSTVGLGIIAALVLGKLVGITAGTWLVTRLRRASLDPDLTWVDVVGVAALGGVGFTVSLLINDLSFGADSDYGDAGKIGVLMASTLAALLATAILSVRNRHYRKLKQADEADDSYANE